MTGHAVAPSLATATATATAEKAPHEEEGGSDGDSQTDRHGQGKEVQAGQNQSDKQDRQTDMKDGRTDMQGVFVSIIRTALVSGL